jgi:hypothetical protein
MTGGRKRYVKGYIAYYANMGIVISADRFPLVSMKTGSTAISARSRPTGWDYAKRFAGCAKQPTSTACISAWRCAALRKRA